MLSNSNKAVNLEYPSPHESSWTIDVYALSHDNDTEDGSNKTFPTSFLNRLFKRKTDDATAFSMYRMGNGPMVMSNVFLSTAFVSLAQMEIGCYNEDDYFEQEPCGKIHGFQPSSLITNIGFISGILSALLLPFVGAVLDCTDYRRTIGIVSACAMMSIQALQIYTREGTWFVMAILQSINGFIYQVHTLAAYAYLPDIATAVGEKKMSKYSGFFSMVMFGSEAFYLMSVVAISVYFMLDDVNTAQLGQLVTVPICFLLYSYAWYFFSEAPRRRLLKEDESVLTTGFLRVFKTAYGIQKHYSSSLGWFLLAVVFAEAGASAFSSVAVTYLIEVLKFKGHQVGLIFLVVLIFTIPGSSFGTFVTKHTCPRTSLRLQLVTFMVVNAAAFLGMDARDPPFVPYCFAALWGFLLGWFYPVETFIFSMTMPKGQEAELTGFFLYCTQIMGWLPPLIFTLMNEGGIELKWGGLHLNVYFFIALICYSLMDPWEKCLEASEVNKMLKSPHGVREFNRVAPASSSMDSGILSVDSAFSTIQYGESFGFECAVKTKHQTGLI